MEIGLFQLLPAPEGRPDGDVIDAALEDAAEAEALGFDSVWIAEHHASPFGLASAAPVYAAAVASRTRRIDVGLAVAVVPLHHPLRLAEEIAWLTHLARGRVRVGVGPGFAPREFAAYGVPLEERRERFEEGTAIVRRLLEGDASGFRGRFWSLPPLALRPRPSGVPPILRACSSPAAAEEAARRGDGVLLGLQPLERLAGTIAAYRAARAELGVPAGAIDEEIARFRVLRRVVVAEDGSRAESEAHRAVAWEEAAAHALAGGSASSPGASSHAAAIPGACVGTPAVVAEDLARLSNLGLRHVIAWTSFGDLPEGSARRSMDLLASEVRPALSGVERLAKGA